MLTDGQEFAVIIILFIIIILLSIYIASEATKYLTSNKSEKQYYGFGKTAEICGIFSLTMFVLNIILICFSIEMV